MLDREFWAYRWRVQSLEQTSEQLAIKPNSMSPADGLRAVAMAAQEDGTKPDPLPVVALNALNPMCATRALTLAMREGVAQWP